jgi:hypothetical protein
MKIFKVGDKVMLNTLNCRCTYKNNHLERVAKFMPRFDGPYIITKAHPKFSTYTLDLPNHPNIFLTFHTSELKRFVANNAELFPSHKDTCLDPVITEEGEEEWAVERIVDERKCSCRREYLVKWVGYGEEENRWLARRKLIDCEALDTWEENGEAKW